MKPTAWLKELPPEDGNGMMMTIIEEVAKEWEEPVIPLYSKGAWVDLTDDEMLMIYGQDHEGKKYNLGRMVQHSLKEKNT